MSQINRNEDKANLSNCAELIDNKYRVLFTCLNNDNKQDFFIRYLTERNIAYVDYKDYVSPENLKVGVYCCLNLKSLQSYQYIYFQVLSTPDWNPDLGPAPNFVNDVGQYIFIDFYLPVDFKKQEVKDEEEKDPKDMPMKSENIIGG